MSIVLVPVSLAVMASLLAIASALEKRAAAARTAQAQGWRRRLLGALRSSS